MVIYKWDLALWRDEKERLVFGGLETGSSMALRVNSRRVKFSAGSEFVELARARVAPGVNSSASLKSAWVRLVVGDFEELGVAAIV